MRGRTLLTEVTQVRGSGWTLVNPQPPHQGTEARASGLQCLEMALWALQAEGARFRSAGVLPAPPAPPSAGTPHITVAAGLSLGGCRISQRRQN